MINGGKVFERVASLPLDFIFFAICIRTSDIYSFRSCNTHAHQCCAAKADILGEMVSVFNGTVTRGFELKLADAVISIALCFKTFRSAQQISLCVPCTHFPRIVLDTEPMLRFSHSCDSVYKAFCCLNPEE